VPIGWQTPVLPGVNKSGNILFMQSGRQVDCHGPEGGVEPDRVKNGELTPTPIARSACRQIDLASIPTETGLAAVVEAAQATCRKIGVRE
jgi:hypothetical protein